ncbi:hypothetical protein N7490_004476 [Penicillium lividum]|nr:hypothetical protein N7490_004476 [Penicillium lividum]
MDFTDVGIRHTILNSLQLHHFIDFSPSAAAIAKEARLCVIAIVAGWITTRVVSSLCELPRRSKSCEHCGSNYWCNTHAQELSILHCPPAARHYQSIYTCP